jgi:LPXTG-motif cell wall-anchored protein
MGWIRKGSAALLVAGGFGMAGVNPAESQVPTTSTPTTTSTSTSTSTSVPASTTPTSTPTSAVTTTTAVTPPAPAPPGSGLVVTGTCFDAASGTYFWTIQNQTTVEIEVDLVLNGVPLGELIVPAVSTETVGNASSGLLQALVDDVVQAESSSSDAACIGPPPPTVSPSVVDGENGGDGEDGEEGQEGAEGDLPSTGASEGALLGAGLACAFAGMILLAARRRGATTERHRTPVRG